MVFALLNDTDTNTLIAEVMKNISVYEIFLDTK